MVPDRPSQISPCIYYTNNSDTLKAAQTKGWKGIMINVATPDSERECSMLTKELKACPHHFPELRGFTYTCYLDSKRKVSEAIIEQIIKTEMNGNVVMMLNKHQDFTTIEGEFNEAMNQERYRQDKDKYSTYIQEALHNGKQKNPGNHYETNVILRKSGAVVEKLGEEWLKDIRALGPECQISFWSIQQNYPGAIKPFSVYFGLIHPPTR